MDAGRQVLATWLSLRDLGRIAGFEPSARGYRGFLWGDWTLPGPLLLPTWPPSCAGFYCTGLPGKALSLEGLWWGHGLTSELVTHPLNTDYHQRVWGEATVTAAQGGGVGD